MKEVAVENPPLWVWAVIVGVIIAGKFIYRWRVTKELAKEPQERKEMQYSCVSCLCLLEEEIVIIQKRRDMLDKEDSIINFDFRYSKQKARERLDATVEFLEAAKINLEKLLLRPMARKKICLVQ